MAVSAIEFWQQLTRIGIVDSVTGVAWMKRFEAGVAKRASAPKAPADHAIATDAVAVAQYLIAKKVLTKFQSQRLLAGRSGELRVGDYLILDRCDSMPMSRWYRSRHLGSSTECFLYPCTDALTSSRWVDPTWLRTHDTVNADGLQRVKILSLSASDPWRGAVVSELPPGRCLDQWADDQGPLEHSTVASIGTLIAKSLAAMHAAGLVHGEVRPSRVWCGEDRSLWLLRDAGRPPAHPDDPPQEHRWFDDDTVADLYAAPELAQTCDQATISSDIFSLGALLYGLAARHTIRQRGGPYQLPMTVIAAKNAGASGDPLMRTIAYAIDPDPEARFPDVDGFAKALSAVVSAYETIQPPQQPQPTQPQPTQPTIIPVNDLVTATASPQVAVQRELAKPQQVTAQKPVAIKPVSNLQPPIATLPAEPTERLEPVATKKLTPPPEPIADITSSALPPPVASGVSPTRQVLPFGLPASEQSEPQAPPLQPPPPAKTKVAEVASSSSSSSSPSSSSTSSPAATAESVPPTPAEPPRSMRRRKRRTRRGPIIVGSVAVLILLVLCTLFLRPSAENQASRPLLPPPPPPRVTATSSTDGVKPTPKPSTTNTDGTPSSPTEQGSFELVQDDRLLWASPWSPHTKPPSLEMIPPGSQLIVSLRMSRLVGDPARSPWLDWMGPEIAPALASIEKRSGLKATQIDRLTIATLATSTDSTKSAYTITVNKPMPLKMLAESWGASPSRTKDGQTIYSGDEPNSDAYFVKPAEAEEVRTFVFGPVELVSLVAENEGEAIPLPRSLQQLWDTASEEADCIAMTVPNFLFADGREILKSYAPKSIAPLRSLLIPDVAGVILSMGLVDSWYVETRFTPSGTVSAPAISQAIQPRIAALPGWAEAFTIDVNVESSWRAISNRLPQFMRAISDQTRFGVSRLLPTANFYLPAEAAPQVSLAAVLALSTPEVSPAVAVVVAESTPMAPMTAEQMIDAHLSVSFDQESLEFAVANIRDEFIRTLPAGATPPTIKIIGGDLEKLGITQNQQIRNFTISDKALRDALSELVRQANPDKSATGLTDEKQTLVWVVDSTAATPTILITTRPAAIAKTLKLTKEFTGN